MSPWLNAALLATVLDDTGESGARASADVCAWSFSAGVAVRDLGSSEPSVGTRFGFCSARAPVWVAGGADFRLQLSRPAANAGVWAHAFWSFGGALGPGWEEAGIGLDMSSILPDDYGGLLSIEMFVVSPRWVLSSVAVRFGTEAVAPVDGSSYRVFYLGVDVQVPTQRGGAQAQLPATPTAAPGAPPPDTTSRP